MAVVAFFFGTLTVSPVYALLPDGKALDEGRLGVGDVGGSGSGSSGTTEPATPSEPTTPTETPTETPSGSHGGQGDQGGTPGGEGSQDKDKGKDTKDSKDAKDAKEDDKDKKPDAFTEALEKLFKNVPKEDRERLIAAMRTLHSTMDALDKNKEPEVPPLNVREAVELKDLLSKHKKLFDQDDPIMAKTWDHIWKYDVPNDQAPPKAPPPDKGLADRPRDQFADQFKGFQTPEPPLADPPSARSEPPSRGWLDRIIDDYIVKPINDAIAKLPPPEQTTHTPPPQTEEPPLAKVSPPPEPIGVMPREVPEPTRYQTMGPPAPTAEDRAPTAPPIPTQLAQATQAPVPTQPPAATPPTNPVAQQTQPPPPTKSDTPPGTEEAIAQTPPTLNQHGGAPEEEVATDTAGNAVVKTKRPTAPSLASNVGNNGTGVPHPGDVDETPGDTTPKPATPGSKALQPIASNTAVAQLTATDAVANVTPPTILASPQPVPVPLPDPLRSVASLPKPGGALSPVIPTSQEIAAALPPPGQQGQAGQDPGLLTQSGSRTRLFPSGFPFSFPGGTASTGTFNAPGKFGGSNGFGPSYVAYGGPDGSFYNGGGPRGVKSANGGSFTPVGGRRGAAGAYDNDGDSDPNVRKALALMRPAKSRTVDQQLAEGSLVLARRSEREGMAPIAGMPLAQRQRGAKSLNPDEPERGQISLGYGVPDELLAGARGAFGFGVGKKGVKALASKKRNAFGSKAVGAEARMAALPPSVGQSRGAAPARKLNDLSNFTRQSKRRPPSGSPLRVERMGGPTASMER